MRQKQNRIVNDSGVAQILTLAINSSLKTQDQICNEVGSSKSNIITMIKQGRTPLPLGRVIAFAESLNLAPDRLMTAVLKEKYLDHWKGIANTIHKSAEKGHL